MKYLLLPFLICVICCMLACTNSTTEKTSNGTDSIVVKDNIDTICNIAAIDTTSYEQLKQKLLSCEDKKIFYFSDDEDFQSNDPNAYQLMNRMMQMLQYVETADDGWAWMLAMNDCISEYNKHIEHEEGSIQNATLAIENLIDTYYAGNQRKMNTASYVTSILESYRTIYAYYDMIGGFRVRDSALKDLCFSEYKAWFDMNNALNNIMIFFTYSNAGYSMAPMEMNHTSFSWYQKRHEELEIERSIYDSVNWKAFESKSAIVSPNEFNKFIQSFKNVVAPNPRSKPNDIDSQSDGEHDNEKSDNEKTAEMLSLYERALIEWRNIREQIAQLLPQQKQESYRQITKQMHTRFYNDLLSLRTTTY